MGMSRLDWEAIRKKKLAKQGKLTVNLKDIRPGCCDNNTAELMLSQEYSSVNYKDIVQKTLSFEFVNNAWRITRETVTQGKTF